MKTHFILVLAMAQAALAEAGDTQAAGQGIRIAVVQQEGNPGKPEENRNKAVGFARQALDQGADVVRDIIVTNVVPDKVAAMRAKNPWYRGQRPDLYQQAIARPQ